MPRPDQRLLLPTAPDAAPISRRSSAVGGVFPRPDAIRREDEPASGETLPYAFDLSSIVAAPASGTTTTLIGAGALAQLQRVPPRCRAYIDAIEPYLEDAVGPVTQARIPGLGVVITWKVLIGNRPAGYYGAITSMLDTWSYMSPRPLLEIPESETFQVTVTNVDAFGIYKFLGIRVRGRWVPWKKKERGGQR